jgi:hypothetical protein
MHGAAACDREAWLSRLAWMAAKNEGLTPWSWASLPGLDYRPGTTSIVVPLFDAADWRGAIFYVTSRRLPSREYSPGERREAGR